MKINSQYLYELLPAYYRLLDEKQGGQLKALMAVLAREAGIVEENIAQLYENWFIETCDEWVVPYIGDLLGVKAIHEIEEATVYSRRAYVANTLGYRRRKGTAPVLEQLALDVTGWRAKAVEFFKLLATTQNVNHIRLHNLGTPGLRQMNMLDLLNTPFDSLGHTADVGRISAGEGLYNISNIGLYLWRLQSYPMEGVTARLLAPESGMPNGCYTFNPLGLDMQLFNRPQTEKEITHLTAETNVPGLLRRRAVHDELEAARQAIANGTPLQYQYFNPKYPAVFQLFINGEEHPIPPEKIVICNLQEWRLPPSTKTYFKDGINDSSTEIPLPITAAVDPSLGRITFSDPDAVAEVLVHYNYGFSGDLGGGPYDRKKSSKELGKLQPDWHVGVSKSNQQVNGEPIFESLEAAITAWNGLQDAHTGLITIMDNQTYEEHLSAIDIPEGKKLYIIAANWPVLDLPDSIAGEKYRKPGLFHPEDLRPHLKGDLKIQGIAPPGSPNGGVLILNGLLIEGKISIQEGHLSECAIQHCSLAPPTGGIEVKKQQNIFRLDMMKSICGHIAVNADDAIIKIEDSIVGHHSGMAISVPLGQLALNNTTVFGKTSTQALDASNTIFTEIVEVERKQLGCVRFSYVPWGSNTPRRYRCQPELEIQTQIKIEEEKAPLSNAERIAIRNKVLQWLHPIFSSLRFGDHHYSQLAINTPIQIRSGADNGAEMGAFNFLQQPQREANIKIVLEEYLPLGLEAGIIYVT
jgi:hypothetical protein